MKKLMVFGISLFILLCLVSASVRVNEVMSNPEDTSICSQADCTEWIELYADSSTSLVNWFINTTNEKTNFSYNIDDYLIITKNKSVFIEKWSSVDESKVIEWRSMSLLNGGESIFLFDDSLELKDSVEYPDFSAGLRDNTYSLLANSSWIVCDEPTPGAENSCEDPPDPNPDPEPEIYLEVDWDEDDIVNGEEFEIKVEAFNLKNEEYNLKIWIEEEDDDTVISERYDDDEEEWKSGRFYVDNFFEGPGNESRDIDLKIRDSYNDYKGDAILKARLEGEDFLLEEDIEIIEKEEDTDDGNVDDDVDDDVNDDNNVNNVDNVNDNVALTGGVISLGDREELEEEKNKVIYESGSEKGRRYALYALNVVLIVIIIFLIKKKV